MGAESAGLFFQWWAWAVLAIALFGLEVLAPGFIFLGFGIGAAIIAALMVFGLMGSNLAVVVLVFAAISLLAWFGLRQALGVRKGQVKKWDRDINDDP